MRKLDKQAMAREIAAAEDRAARAVKRMPCPSFARRCGRAMTWAVFGLAFIMPGMIEAMRHAPAWIEYAVRSEYLPPLTNERVTAWLNAMPGESVDATVFAIDEGALK